MITIIGEALVTLVPAPGSSVLRALPGGSAFGTAVRAARLGYPTALMARLSRDLLGQILRTHAARCGVDLGAAPEADEPTMIAVAATPADLDSTDSLYFRGTASWQWSAAELGWIQADTRVLHLDSLACCVPPGSPRILRAAARQRNHGAIVCLNVNVKPAMMEPPARGRLLMDRPIRSGDVVRASVDDIAWLYPGRSPEAVAQLWLGTGPKLVALANGSDGVVAIRDSGAVLHRAAARSDAEAVAGFDTAFTGALLGRLHQLRCSRAGLADLNTGELGSMLDAATAAASTFGRSCANPAVAAESSDLLSSYPIPEAGGMRSLA